MPGPQVFHVITRYRFGGSEARLRDVIAALDDAEHTVILGEGSDPAHAARGLPGARIVALPTLVRRPDPYRDGRALRSLIAAIERLRPDLVVTHQSKAGVLGRVAAHRAAGSRPSVHSLSMASFGAGYPRWQDTAFRQIESRIHSITAAYAVVGEDLAGRYRSIGVPGQKLHVIRSGVSLPAPIPEAERARVRAEIGVSGGERPLVLSLGSLEPRKNVLSLVPFMASLRRTLTSIPFLVVAGDGPLRAELLEDVRRAGLGDDVAILGHVADPRRLLAAADVLVLLSEVEGLPQVLVQAAAAGTPFVAYDVDGVRELLALGATGIPVASRDLRGAVGATSRLLSEHRPPVPGVDLRAWAPAMIADKYRQLVRSLVPTQIAATVSSEPGASPHEPARAVQGA